MKHVRKERDISKALIVIIVIGALAYFYLNVFVENQIYEQVMRSSPGPLSYSPSRFAEVENTQHARQSSKPKTQDPILYEEQIWLEGEQLQHYLQQMRVKNVNFQNQGRIFLAVDWNASKKTDRLDHLTSEADSGRKISIGFEKTHQWGSRWGGLQLEYSTYDFSTGSEYDTYGKKNDYIRIKSGEYKGAITVDGVQGLVNYQVDPFFRIIKKTVVFPFEKYYIAVNYYFQEDMPNPAQTVSDLYAGKYPESEKENLKMVDQLVSSLQFIDRQ